MHQIAQFLTTFYSLIVMILGFIGYQQGGSLLSLIIGGGLGLILFLFCIGMYQKKKWAPIGALVIVLILFFSFLYRFNTTIGFMPAILALFSGIISYLLIRKLYSTYRNL